ncbi:MAG: tyrosine-type recombinase/integrase [Planctomycetota bacterium]|nr:tyrosine-type recombinase/integrase [Planctomycetota bacterium]
MEEVIRELLETPFYVGKGENRKARYRTPLTVQRYVDAVTAMCDWCYQRGYLEDDPLKRLQALSREPKNIRRAMTLPELQKLLEHCDPHRRMTYEVAFASGLRANELRSLTVADLDAERGGLKLNANWTKRRVQGFQNIGPTLVARLVAASKDKRPEEPILFVPRHTARDLDKDLKRAGIPKWAPGGKLDFHACRVAYNTFLFEVGAGADIKTAQDLMRHKDAHLTMNVYARGRESRLAAVAEAVGNAVVPRVGIAVAQRLAAGAENQPPITASANMAGVHGKRPPWRDTTCRNVTHLRKTVTPLRKAKRIPTRRRSLYHRTPRKAAQFPHTRRTKRHAPSVPLACHRFPRRNCRTIYGNWRHFGRHSTRRGKRQSWRQRGHWPERDGEHMRGGRREGAGRRGLKTAACRLPVELHRAVDGHRLPGESFAAAALRLLRVSVGQTGTPDAQEARV